MKLSRLMHLVVISVSAFSLAPLAFAIHPTWARKAIAFPSQCEIPSKEPHRNDSPKTALQPPAGDAACKPLRIPSPDQKLILKVRYRRDKIGKGYDDILTAYFLLCAQNGACQAGDFPIGFQDIDLLWSPDSKAFFVNGGNGGGYWGFFVNVYRIDDPKLKPLDITKQAQRDMVKAFPPCKASQLDLEECRELEKNPGYNMSGIDWSNDSSALVVMAEIPCSGGHGGIMCQVMGYELEVPTGNIVGRTNAREFKKNWQKSMAWKFDIPDPPEYCVAENRKTVPGCLEHDW